MGEESTWTSGSKETQGLVDEIHWVRRSVKVSRVTESWGNKESKQVQTWDYFVTEEKVRKFQGPRYVEGSPPTRDKSQEIRKKLEILEEH